MESPSKTSPGVVLFMFAIAPRATSSCRSTAMGLGRLAITARITATAPPINASPPTSPTGKAHGSTLEGLASDAAPDRGGRRTVRRVLVALTSDVMLLETEYLGDTLREILNDVDCVLLFAESIAA